MKSTNVIYKVGSRSHKHHMAGEQDMVRMEGMAGKNMDGDEGRRAHFLLLRQQVLPITHRQTEHQRKILFDHSEGFDRHTKWETSLLTCIVFHMHKSPIMLGQSRNLGEDFHPTGAYCPMKW